MSCFLNVNLHVILSQARYWRAVPELVLGFVSIVGAALCLLLQETTNKALPQTLEEGENFGVGEDVWDFACCKRKLEIRGSA